MAIGAIFGGIASLIGALAQAQAAREAAAVERENLGFQKSQAKRSEKFAKAGRTDAFGNEQSFDDLLNEWKIMLAPEQAKILQAGEKEQLSSLTEDAGRNRRTRRRQEDRAVGAGDLYQQALAGLQYDEAPSEDSIRDDLTGLISSNRAATAKQNQASVGRVAMRAGQGQDFAGIIKETDAALGEGGIQDALTARNAAIGESATREQAKQSKYGPIISQMAQLMDAVGASPQMFSDLPQQLSGQQGETLSRLIQTLQANAGAVGGAYSKYAGRVAQTAFDPSGIGQALSGLDSLFNRGSATAAEPEKPLIYNPSKGEQLFWPSDRLRQDQDF